MSITTSGLTDYKFCFQQVPNDPRRKQPTLICRKHKSFQQNIYIYIQGHSKHRYDKNLQNINLQTVSLLTIRHKLYEKE